MKRKTFMKQLRRKLGNRAFSKYSLEEIEAASYKVFHPNEIKDMTNKLFTEYEKSFKDLAEYDKAPEPIPIITPQEPKEVKKSWFSRLFK